MKGKVSKSVLAFVVAFALLFTGTGCEKIVDREIEVNRGVRPDEISVEDITLEKGESKAINVTFNPGDAYTRYAFSVPVERQSEISIYNGVVKGLKAAAAPVPVTCYALDESLELTATFNVKVEGYYDPVDGPIYAFNRMGSFDYPVPADSLDPGATGWSVTNNGTEDINTLTLSYYDAEEEARDPGATRWAPRYSHDAVEKNNLKIFDQFEFDVTLETELVNVPAGKWYFSMFMEGNNVQASWNITGLDAYEFPIAATPTWYYRELEFTQAVTLQFSLRLVGETTNPDDDKTSPWIFFDSIRAINSQNAELEDDVPPVVEVLPYTNYVTDGNFGAAETNVPIGDMTDYVWKVGPSLRDGTLNLSNSQLDIVSSDTNFLVDGNGKSGKFKTTVTGAGRVQRFSVYQDVVGIPHNFYSYTGYFMGNPDNQTRENQYLRMFVTYNDIKGQPVTVFKNIRTESYFNGYIQNTLEGIEITDGRARIGFDFYRSTSGIATWGSEQDCWFQFDDISLIATNELNEEEVNIFNTWGLTQLLPTDADLGDVSDIASTGWELEGENASADIDTNAQHSAVGANSIKVTTTEAADAALKQTLTGLTAGQTYVLSSHIKGSGEFNAFVSADGKAGTAVNSSGVYLQSYIEFTADGDTAELAINVQTPGAVSVYLDWIICASTSVSISVQDIENLWVGDSQSALVQFIPSSKAEACVFEVVSETVAGAVAVSEDGVVSAFAAGTSVIRATHEASGATTTFSVTATERPLLTSISIEDRVRPLGSVISTKLLLITRTPATAIMTDVTYSIAEGSQDLVALSGTRLTMVKAGVATINVSAKDAKGGIVSSSFDITIQTVQEANRVAGLARFNKDARSIVSFEEGGWTVVSNNGSGTPTFTANNVFANLWVKDNPAVYNFMAEQTFVNMQAGTYTMTMTMTAGVGGGGITLTGYANGNEHSQLFNSNWPAPTHTVVVTAVVAEDGGTLKVGFSITGSLTGSGSLWGDGITALSLEWAPLE